MLGLVLPQLVAKVVGKMALRWPCLGFSSHFLQPIYLSLQKTSASPLSLSIYLSKYRAPLKFQLYLWKKNAILVPAPYCPRRWCWCQTAPYTRRRESWLLTKYSFSLVREPAAAQLPTHGLGLLSCLPPALTLAESDTVAKPTALS